MPISLFLFGKKQVDIVDLMYGMFPKRQHSATLQLWRADLIIVFKNFIIIQPSWGTHAIPLVIIVEVVLSAKQLCVLARCLFGKANRTIPKTTHIFIYM